MRELNPTCFVWGERDKKAKDDVDELFRALSLGTGGREKTHKLDAKIELKNTDLAGQALLGPQAQALGVQPRIVEFIKKVMSERKAIPWTDFEAASNPLTLVILRAVNLKEP